MVIGVASRFNMYHGKIAALGSTKVTRGDFLDFVHNMRDGELDARTSLLAQL